MNRLSDEGHDIRVLILSMGFASRGEVEDEDFDKLQEDSARACEILGVVDRIVDDFPDNEFDSVSLLEIVQSIEQVIENFKPTILLTHSMHDLNVDHRITAQAVLTATRPPCSVKEIYAFEIPSSTEWAFGEFGSFKPNYFVELSEDDLQAKVKAMECYETEARIYPHPRSPEAIIALAQVRGVQSGVRYAEAFELIRSIN